MVSFFEFFEPERLQLTAAIKPAKSTKATSLRISYVSIHAAVPTASAAAITGLFNLPMPSMSTIISSLAFK